MGPRGEKEVVWGGGGWGWSRTSAATKMTTEPRPQEGSGAGHRLSRPPLVALQADSLGAGRTR